MCPNRAFGQAGRHRVGVHIYHSSNRDDNDDDDTPTDTQKLIWKRWSRWTGDELIAPGSTKLHRFVNYLVNVRDAMAKRRKSAR
jgi:hypothetical protein